MAAIPVFVAAGPLALPAFAADPFTVSNLVNDGQIVGPNAGFLGMGIGQSGSTAMFKVVSPDETSAITGIEVTLSDMDDPFSYSHTNELDDNDGLALYADVNHNGQFDAPDKAAGPKSQGFRVPRAPQNGEIPFALRLDNPVSGAGVYFVAVHPKSYPLTSGRRFVFQLKPGAVQTTSGNVPTQAVTTPTGDNRMRVDSAAPAAADRNHFVPAPKPPMVNPGDEEDSYTVSRSASGGDPAARVVLFNSANSTAGTAVLRRPAYDPAKPFDVQPANLAVRPLVEGDNATVVVPIGDGTGVVQGQTKLALNNQINNSVFARIADSVGNLSGATALLQCTIIPGQAGCESSGGKTIERGNPVVGPGTPTSAELKSGGVTLTAINLSNYTAVPAEVVIPQAALDARTHSNSPEGSSQAVTLGTRIAELGADGKVDMTRTTEEISKTPATTVVYSGASGINTTLSPDGSAPRGIREGLKIATAVAVTYDKWGNPSAPRLSAAGYTKDITAPSLSVSVPTGNIIKGSKVTLSYSEPMDKTKVAQSRTAGDVCADDTGAGSAEVKLDVQSPAGADRSWGVNYCHLWNTEGSAATITIGDNARYTAPTAANPSPTLIPLPSVGDHVVFGDVTDLFGNKIAGITPGYAAIKLPAATPEKVETRDLDLNGRLDAIDVSFTTFLKLDSANAKIENFQVVSSTTTVPVTAIQTAPMLDSKPTYRFRFTSEFGTGIVPELRLVASPGTGETGVLDGDNKMVGAFSRVATDKAAPQPLRATTTDDSPRDGKIDRILLQYSEPIVPDQDNNPAVPNYNSPAYDVTGYTPPTATGRTHPNNTVSPTTGGAAAANPVKTITLHQPGTHDTGARPMVNYSSYSFAGTEYAPKDTQTPPNSFTSFNKDINGAYSYTVFPDDGAGLFIVSRITRDLDSDGLIDAIDVLFSETLSTFALNSSWEVAGRNINKLELTTPRTLRLSIDEATDKAGDTDAKPGVRYVAGLADLVNNQLAAETAPVTPADGAGPAIVSACAQWPTGSNGSCPADDAAATDDGTKINVVFSEPVKTASVETNGSDFVVDQGGAKTVTGATPGAVANAAASSFTLTFAVNTIDPKADASVKLAGADKVEDLAAVKNTQTAPVTALAGPIVTMVLTCPTPSTKAGYCSTATINTGITGTPAVTKWRLKNTARGAVVDAAEFSNTRPDTITLVEGKHTLYLSGMDKYGRLSPEVSSTISILTPPAIRNVALANSRTGAGSTVLDGDSIKIGADGVGTDAADWAKDGAATGGNCLAANMSINVSALTGVGSDTAVAPFECNLFTTGDRPYRQMRFPTVTATHTTKFPVGTVVKYSATDPGALIVDGPNGTIARRHFISANARRSWMISDASVVTVPVKLVSALPRQANLGYRDGAVLKAGTRYYFVEEGKKRPVSTTRLRAWKIPTTHAYAPTSTELNRIPTGATLNSARHGYGTFIKTSTGRTYQIVRGKSGGPVLRQLASAAALRTLVPSTHVYPANSYDVKIAKDTWLRGYRDGTLLRKLRADGKVDWYGVIARGSLRKFANSTTFNTLGFNGANALTINELAVPRVSGQPYRIGVEIDRYKIDSVVITVTNNVGSSVTAKVLPATDGLYGVGTFDPAPAGWDTTR